MNDAARIEGTCGLPQWVRRAAGSRLAAVAAAQAKLDEARGDLNVLLHHIRLICGDKDARAWLLAIGVDKATLRRFWKGSRARGRERG
ncbi:MAG: hypothetical protein ACREVP_10360 [Burkholderiales bacterium]